MPFYEYHCPECRQEFEEIRPLAKRDEPAICPKCGSEKPQRKISLFASGGIWGGGLSAGGSACGPGGFT